MEFKDLNKDIGRVHGMFLLSDSERRNVYLKYLPQECLDSYEALVIADSASKSLVKKRWKKHKPSSYNKVYEDMKIYEKDALLFGGKSVKEAMLRLNVLHSCLGPLRKLRDISIEELVGTLRREMGPPQRERELQEYLRQRQEEREEEEQLAMGRPPQFEDVYNWEEEEDLDELEAELLQEVDWEEEEEEPEDQYDLTNPYIQNLDNSWEPDNSWELDLMIDDPERVQEELLEMDPPGFYTNNYQLERSSEAENVDPLMRAYNEEGWTDEFGEEEEEEEDEEVDEDEFLKLMEDSWKRKKRKKSEM